ncbi:hypothetical protein [Rubritalea marina]|uniref:hypothetical protein n=1 Tax=Rubritalea marina TaxID=361055 RepID=UPI0003624665|nr:hypothetical protein [Rubritalea marina]
MSEQRATEDLPLEWTTPRKTAHLHILRAHAAPIAVIIRRKPSKCYHIIEWNTETDELKFGSWFNGRIYAERCDLSWDGKWMVYLAMGNKGQTWNGICEPPKLTTVVDVPNHGTYAGGGYFPSNQKLISNDAWVNDESLSDYSKSYEFPFSIERMESGGAVFPILDFRLERDGWQRQGEMTEDRVIYLKHSPYSTISDDDPGWAWQPTSKHPTLRMFYRGYLVGGYTFEFQLDGHEILGPDVTWATWDFKGDLLVARKGRIERYTLDALKTGTPIFSHNLEDLSLPTHGKNSTFNS